MNFKKEHFKIFYTKIQKNNYSQINIQKQIYK